MTIDEREAAAGRAVHAMVSSHADPEPSLRHLHRRAVRRRRSRTLPACGVALLALLGVVVVAQDRDTARLVAGNPKTPSTAPATTVAAAPSPRGGPPPVENATRLRATGTSGLRRTTEGRVAIRVAGVDGRAAWVTLPADLPSIDGLSVVPDAPIVLDDPATPRAFLTTLSPLEVAELECGGCTTGPILDRTEVLPTGATYTVWSTGHGEPLVTLQREGWMLVLKGPNESLAHRIAAALLWTDKVGYPTLTSQDLGVRVIGPQATVRLFLPPTTGEAAQARVITVTPGCDGNSDAGQPAATGAVVRTENVAYWCVDGYRAEVVGDGPLIDLIYRQMRVSEPPPF